MCCPATDLIIANFFIDCNRYKIFYKFKKSFAPKGAKDRKFYFLFKNNFGIFKNLFKLCYKRLYFAEIERAVIKAHAYRKHG